MVTSGNVADCSCAEERMEGLSAGHPIADKGHDSDKVVEQAKKQGMQVHIPSRKNRKNPREYDKHPYRQRHLVENAFAHIKQCRGIATRYARASRQRTSSQRKRHRKSTAVAKECIPLVHIALLLLYKEQHG